MTGLLMARLAPSTGMSERDSSRALNFARGSFASFLAPSRKEENKFFLLAMYFGQVWLVLNIHLLHTWTQHNYKSLLGSVPLIKSYLK